MLSRSGPYEARSVRRLSDLFAESAQSCRDLPQLRVLLDDVTCELGFDYFALLDHSSLGGAGAGLLRIDNYPAEWVQELIACGYAADRRPQPLCRSGPRRGRRAARQWRDRPADAAHRRGRRDRPPHRRHRGRERRALRH